MDTPVTLKKLNHVAWRCIDAEQTRAFYEDVLGLKLSHTVQSERVPSTGQDMPHLHLFFELADGSAVAFFDVRDGRGAQVPPDMPAWVHHFAFEVATVNEVQAMKDRLHAAGVEVLGITDHGFLQSIYFFDPNGLRLEVTAPTPEGHDMSDAPARARAMLDAWTARKKTDGLVA